MITAHVLVKNEARFVWYSVMSVVSFVDHVLLWDMGSTDGTREIINEILKDISISNKISFKEIKTEGYIFDEPKVRQEMLDATLDEWFLVVDGDEIWWDESIRKVVETINKKGDEVESIVVPTVNLVGDIYHYQEAKAGHYKLAGRIGHYGLRGVNKKIPGLTSRKPHGVWGWTDDREVMIQDRDIKKIAYVEAPYLHATFLPRAGTIKKDQEVYKRNQKLKHEIGNSFPKDFYYPEVFFKKRPSIVPNIWLNMTFGFWFQAMIETPLRKLKRRIMPIKEGY